MKASTDVPQLLLGLDFVWLVSLRAECPHLRFAAFVVHLALRQVRFEARLLTPFFVIIA